MSGFAWLRGSAVWPRGQYRFDEVAELHEGAVFGWFPKIALDTQFRHLRAIPVGIRSGYDDDMCFLGTRTLLQVPHHSVARLSGKVDIENDESEKRSLDRSVHLVQKRNCLLTVLGNVHGNGELGGGDCFANQEHVGFVILDDEDVVKSSRRLIKPGV